MKNVHEDILESLIGQWTGGVSRKIEESRLKRFLLMKGEKSVAAMFKVIERNGNSGKLLCKLN